MKRPIAWLELERALPGRQELQIAHFSKQREHQGPGSLAREAPELQRVLEADVGSRVIRAVGQGPPGGADGKVLDRRRPKVREERLGRRAAVWPLEKGG